MKFKFNKNLKFTKSIVKKYINNQISILKNGYFTIINL